MGRPGVVVYGMSTEGYAAACGMASRGADVSIVDESGTSAISISAEVARTYPTVSSIRDDEIILPMAPMEEAVARARYVLFCPRIRRSGQDLRTEVRAKLRDATSAVRRGGTVVYCLPAGIGGNNENVSLLEHVTGFEVGRTLSYHYLPLGGPGGTPGAAGSFNGAADEALGALLSAGGPLRFVSLASAEYAHAMGALGRFASLCCTLEVCRLAGGAAARAELATDELRGLYVSDMARGLDDLRAVNAASEGGGMLASMVNNGPRCVEGYVKRLVEEVRAELRRRGLKAARARVAVAWEMDVHEMRGDQEEVLGQLRGRLRDYISDVDVYREPGPGLLDSDKATLVLACTAADFERACAEGGDPVVMKANPLYETRG